MEQLTKQQIVLVALLISFITSIATGIVTVALMDQAPPGVTQTINRVVERTIEKVVPAPNQQQAAAVVTKETIVVKEDDLLVKSVEENGKSLVSIISVIGEGEGKSENFAGNGLIVGKDGLIATDSVLTAPAFDGAGNPVPQAFKAVFSDGSALPLNPLSDNSVSGIVLFRPELSDKTRVAAFVPAKLADASALKLGQTIVALGGEKISVATGIVSNLSDMTDVSVSSADATSTSDTIVKKNKPKLIQTNVHDIGKTAGSIIANLSGEVVGIRASAAGEADNFFLPASLITGAISKLNTTSSIVPSVQK